MKRFRLMILGFALGLSSISNAEVLACTAHVTNRLYTVSVDTESLRMSAKSDNGFTYDGIVVRHYSPRTKYITYSLAAGFYASALTLMVDPTQANAMALCLQQTECYTCR